MNPNTRRAGLLAGLVATLGMALGCASPYKDYTKVQTSFHVNGYSLTGKELTLGNEKIGYTTLTTPNGEVHILNEKGEVVRTFREGDLIKTIDSATQQVEAWFLDPTTGQLISINPAEQSGQINMSE